MRKNNKKIGESNTKIDTVQISTNLKNLKKGDNIGDLYNDYRFVSKSPMLNKSGKNIRVRLVLQPSYCYSYFENFSKFSEYTKRLDVMLDNIEIIDKNEININRLDICVDFEDSYKKLYMLGKVVLGLLYCEKTNIDFNFLVTSNELTGKKTHLRLKSNRFEVAFYDKEDESKGQHKYKTRFEFRFKGETIEIGKEIKLIKDLIKDLRKLKNENILGNLENLYAEKIVNTIKESKNLKTLLDYLKAFPEDLITRECVKKAYKELNKDKTTENFDSWFKTLKRYDIKLHKWADIKEFIDILIVNLKQFLKD